MEVSCVVSNVGNGFILKAYFNRSRDGRVIEPPPELDPILAQMIKAEERERNFRQIVRCYVFEDGVEMVTFMLKLYAVAARSDN